MAQLKNSIVQGSLRVTDAIYTNDLIVENTSTPTIASDYLMIVDTSDGNKIMRGPLLDGSTETSILTKKGTWIGVEGTNPINIGMSNGKITISLSSSYNPFSSAENKNTILAAPSTANGVPAFRKLVATDLPTASNSEKGAAIIGTTLSISSDILNVVYGTSTSTALQGNQNLFTLNNSAKNAAANASIYAPTTGGTEGYVLESAGNTTAPVWSNKGNGRIFYGTCSTAAATAAKVVTCAQYDELQNGDIMIVTFTNTNTTNTALTMSITNSTTTTTAKDIKCQIVRTISNIPEVGYLIKDRPYMFVYDGLYWVLINVNRDDNTFAYAIRYNEKIFTIDNTTNGSGRTLYGYKIMLEKPNGQLTPVSTKNNTASNDETIYSDEFLINGGIFYYSAATSINPGGQPSVTTLWKSQNLNLTRSFNTGATLIAGKPVYLKAKPTYRDSPYATLYKNNTWSNMAIDSTTGKGAGCITQTLEGEAAEYVYIKLGYAYTTSSIVLDEMHPVYYKPDYYTIVPYSISTSYFNNLYGITSLQNFKIVIIDLIKKHNCFGSMLPIYFIASNVESSWSESNLYPHEDIAYTGFLNFAMSRYSNGNLATIYGDILFYEIPSTSSLSSETPQIYHWQFIYNEGDSSYGTWRYNFARSIPHINDISLNGDYDNTSLTTQYAINGLKQDTDGLIYCKYAPIKVNSSANSTLPASGWSNTHPYTQTITINSIGFSSNTLEPIVGLNTNGITQEAYEQACEAQIICTNYSFSNSASTFTFTAYGEKPTINIPISIVASYSGNS